MGRWDTIVEEREIPRDDVEQFIGMNGLRLTDIIDYLKAETNTPTPFGHGGIV